MGLGTSPGDVLSVFTRFSSIATNSEPSPNFNASFGTALLYPDLISALPHPLVRVVHTALFIQRRASFAPRKRPKRCLQVKNGRYSTRGVLSVAPSRVTDHLDNWRSSALFRTLEPAAENS